jgi:hypothetical protein
MRQWRSLVLVGDVHVMGAVDGVEDAPEVTGKNNREHGKSVTQRTYTTTGEAQFSNVTGPLQELLKWFGARKRVGAMRGMEIVWGDKSPES